MITEVFLNILKTLMDWLVSIRPTWDMHLPAGVSQFVGWLFAYDNMLPVTEVMTIIGGTATLVTALLIWKWSVKFIDWVTAIIP
jgi:hypothetical protein